MRRRRARLPAQDGVLVRARVRHDRIRHQSTLDLGADPNAGAALRPVARVDYRQEAMDTITDQQFDARLARGVRSTDQGRGVAAHPTRHVTPVLPRGWAPLTNDQQRAVLQACDASPDDLAFRLGALSGSEVDYRVYQLDNETWAGLWVASRCFTDCDGVVSNRELLGLGSDAVRAVRIVLDFFNSDLQAHGETWRLQAELPAVPPGDPERV
jgi:hypothetical protein